MTVTPFTMQDVINGVLNQMRYAPGRDVQIHLQSSIAQDASMLYRTLMLKYQWRDFTQHASVVTDSQGIPNPKTVVGIVSGLPLERYADILAVYKDKDNQPLQFSHAYRSAVGTIRRPMVSWTHAAPAVFRIVPDGVYNLSVVFRNYRDTDFDLDDVIPFYFDLLVMGTSLALCTKSGINRELSQLLTTQFNEMLNTYRDQEVKPQYQVNPAQGAVPTEWYSTDQ